MELLRMGPYTMHTRTVTLATFHLLRISHIRNSSRVTFHILRISHIRNSGRATFHLLRISHIRNSGRVTFHLLRIFHIWRLTPDGKGGRFNFSCQTYPDLLIALTRRVSQPFCTVSIALTRRVSQPCCIVLQCSPEAFRYVRPTF